MEDIDSAGMRFMQAYEKGELIFDQDSQGEEMFVVIKGSVDILQKQKGAFKHLATLGKGDIFGEMALVDRIPRTARAVSAEDGTQLIVANHSRFVYLASQQPVFALFIMKVLCQRIQKLEKKQKALLEEMTS